jgi:hypothetical protein|tara:strand:- start:2560 stop:2748 length:189 start_codon:yes stop_codon:yes gene_type:complete
MSALGDMVIKSLKVALLTFFTEKMVLKLILDLLRWGSEQTTNKIDDKIVTEYEDRLKESGVI